MVKCQICKRERLVFFCTTIAGSHIIACINCAVACGLKIIEEVLEVKSEGLETDSSRKGQSLSDLQNNRE